MQTIKVVPYKYLRNTVTGQTVSLGGSAPYTNDADAKNWVVVESGWTAEYNDNGRITRGRAGQPYPLELSYSACCAIAKGTAAKLGITYLN